MKILFLFLSSSLLLVSCKTTNPSVMPSYEAVGGRLEAVATKAKGGEAVLVKLREKNLSLAIDLDAALAAFRGIQTDVIVARELLAENQKKLNWFAQDHANLSAWVTANKPKLAEKDARIWQLWIALIGSWIAIAAFMAFRTKLKALPFIGWIIP